MGPSPFILRHMLLEPYWLVNYGLKTTQLIKAPTTSGPTHAGVINIANLHTHLATTPLPATGRSHERPEP